MGIGKNSSSPEVHWAMLEYAGSHFVVFIICVPDACNALVSIHNVAAVRENVAVVAV